MQRDGKSKEKTDLVIKLVLVGLFLFPVFVRHMFFASFYQMNYFAFLGALLILIYTLRGGKLRGQDILPYALILILLWILIISEIHAGRTLKGGIRVFGGLLMPLFLLFYTPKNPLITIKRVVTIFNIVSAAVVVMGIVDLLSDRIFILRYYQLARDYNYYNMADESFLRIYSYLGHPLYNAELFLMTFGLNYAYNELIMKNHKNDKWIIILTLIGVVMSASKGAITVYLGLLIVLYIKNWKYMMFSLLVLGMFFFNGWFDYVISRFSGSLTTGRNEMWDLLMSTGEDFFHFFWGNGSDSKYAYDYINEWAKAAFEYPVRLFALEFGILFSGIVMFVSFIYPVIKLYRHGAKWMMLSVIFVGVSLFVNTYNGIGTYSDAMYLFCLFGCIMLNISRLAGTTGVVHKKGYKLEYGKKIF